jgi:hypothetical protein
VPYQRWHWCGDRTRTRHTMRCGARRGPVCMALEYTNRAGAKQRSRKGAEGEPLTRKCPAY